MVKKDVHIDKFLDYRTRNGKNKIRCRTQNKNKNEVKNEKDGVGEIKERF